MATPLIGFRTLAAIATLGLLSLGAPQDGGAKPLPTQTTEKPADLASGKVRGPESHFSAAPVLAKTRVLRPFLYAIEGNSVRPNYFFGTVHAGVTALELPQSVGRAISASNSFVMEVLPPKGMRTLGPSQIPMDFALAQYAKRKGKPLFALESLEFQEQLLASLALEPFAHNRLDVDDDDLQCLAEVYRSGKLQALAELTGIDDPLVEERLLHRRNKAWRRQLEVPLRSGGVFVAVGAAHLAGKGGLLDTAVELGYSVQQIT